MKKIFAITVIILIFSVLRVYKLKENVNFSADQGFMLLESYKIWNTKTLTLIGPASSFETKGRFFFQGPATYYIPIPALLMGKWNPLAASYFLIFLNLASLVFLTCVMLLLNEKVTFIVSYLIFFSFFPYAVRYSQFHWNPNYTIPVSTAVLATVLLWIKGYRRAFPTFLTGLLLGFGLQFHYSYLIVVVFIPFILITKKIKSVKEYLSCFFGFILGFSPIIIFELRHNFYNSETFLLFLRNGSSGTKFFPHDYYFLCLYPFIFYLSSFLLHKLFPRYSYIAFVILFFYISLSLFPIFNTYNHGFNMVTGWNYDGILKIKEKILEEKYDNYNVVDLLTGDTRAMSTRYLLTVNNNPPMAVEDYPGAEYLFVYSKDPIEQILKGNLWEIDSIRPVTVIKTWEVQNGINLYLLKKAQISAVLE